MKKEGEDLKNSAQQDKQKDKQNQSGQQQGEKENEKPKDEGKSKMNTRQLSKEEAEMKILFAYLPAQMSEDEVRVKVKEVLDSNKFDNFGLAMNAVMKVVGKDAEGGTVAKIVKELFK